ncbi:hypothetical protein ABZP36_020724 [Zizania latifolia]
MISLPLPRVRNLTTVYRLVVNNFLAAVAVPAVAAVVLLRVAQLGAGEVLARLGSVRSVHLFLAVFVPSAAAVVHLMRRPRSVYLVDYACFRPQPSFRISLAAFVEHCRLVPYIDDGSFRFLTRMLARSGLGDRTYVHHSSMYLPPCSGLDEARNEMEQVVFGAFGDLFAKTRVRPEEIDILVTNCCTFNPTPSFADVVVNRFKLRADIRAVHVSGMGCSAGLISVEVARNLLQAAPRGAHALVVSMESTSFLNYEGRSPEMLLPMALFRMGSVAMLLSTSRGTSRFRLTHIVRTLTASEDRAYRCVLHEEDDDGKTGVNLSRDLVAVAGETLKANIAALGSRVLPPSEKLLFALSFVARKVMGQKAVKMYVPDFRTAFEHFCIHAGGRAVIDAVQSSLGLSDEDVEPSRMTLHRSCADADTGPWADSIHQYPMAAGAIPKLF